MENQPVKPIIGGQTFTPKPSVSIPQKKSSDEPKTRKKRTSTGNFPRASVKRLIVASGLRTQPEVITMAETYLVKVLKDVTEECRKLAVEDKRSTIYEKDIEKVLRFKPFCDI